MSFDFSSYVASHTKNSSHRVEPLTDGYTNFTARIVFDDEPAAAAVVVLDFGPRTIAIGSKSVILKHAPPYIATDPTQPMSVARQLTEVRALRLITAGASNNMNNYANANDTADSRESDQLPPLEAEEGADSEEPNLFTGFKDLLDRFPTIKVPKVIYHDAEQHVLWLSDLGDIKSVARLLAEGGGGESTTERLQLENIMQTARHLGEFLAGFYAVSKTVPRGVVDRIAESSNTYTAGIDHYVATAAREALVQEGVEDAQELAERVKGALEEKRMMMTRNREKEDNSQTGSCLGMVDFWPGSVLLSPDGKTCGLIDWEYFGVSNEADELGMFLAHMHVTILKPTTSTEGRQRLRDFMRAMFEAYREHPDSDTQSKTFQRRFLISYGRELVNGAGSLYTAELDTESSKKIMAAGIRCLRAAGKDGAEVDFTFGGAEQEAWIWEILHALGLPVSEV